MQDLPWHKVPLLEDPNSVLDERMDGEMTIRDTNELQRQLYP